MTGPTSAPAEIWRLFVAIRLPRATADAIVTLARAVPPPAGPVRWVEPADLHVTIWFIGDLPMPDVPAVRARLARLAADAASFDVEAAGAGTFGRGRGRATWVGLTAPGAGRMADLAVGLGDGPFHAHVTVVRGAPPDFAAGLAGHLAAASPIRWRATALELLRSHPGRRPAYETVGRFPFGSERATA